MLKQININLPPELISAIEEKIKDTQFDNISDYIVFLLEQVVEVDNKKYENEKIINQKEEEEITRKLQELGYI